MGFTTTGPRWLCQPGGGRRPGCTVYVTTTVREESSTLIEDRSGVRLSMLGQRTTTFLPLPPETDRKVTGNFTAPPPRLFGARLAGGYLPMLPRAQLEYCLRPALGQLTIRKTRPFAAGGHPPLP
jgi:hypothetical protein